MLIIYVFMRWAEAKQAKLVRDASKAMGLDARFDSLREDLVELNTLYNEWQVLASAAAGGDSLKIDDKNIKRNETMAKLYKIAMKVNILCDGKDTNLAIASGLPMKATPAPVESIEKPLITDILRTVNSGTVKLVWTYRRGVISYAIESSVDGGLTWQNGTYCKSVKKKMGGYVPGVEVAFRVRAIGSTVESDWSDEKSIMMA